MMEIVGAEPIDHDGIAWRIQLEDMSIIEIGAADPRCAEAMDMWLLYQDVVEPIDG